MTEESIKAVCTPETGDNRLASVQALVFERFGATIFVSKLKVQSLNPFRSNMNMLE